MIRLILFLFLAKSFAYGASVTFAWNANEEPTLGGYKLHLGNATRAYTRTNQAGATETRLTIANLPAGRYYAALTAVTTDGLESEFSDEVRFDIIPKKPGGFRVEIILQAGATVEGPWINIATLSESLTNGSASQFYRGIVTVTPK